MLLSLIPTSQLTYKTIKYKLTKQQNKKQNIYKQIPETIPFTDKVMAVKRTVKYNSLDNIYKTIQK